jgi:hypothetical protein
MEGTRAARTGNPRRSDRRRVVGRPPARRLGLWWAAALAALLPLSLAGSANAAAPPTGDAGTAIATALAGTVAGSVDAGSLHTCGVRTNGTVACRGYNDSAGRTPPGAPSPE